MKKKEPQQKHLPLPLLPNPKDQLPLRPLPAAKAEQ